jgi:serine/threonine protein kinase
VGSYKWLQFNGQQEIFRVLRFINEGCYGKVYLVQHVPTNFVCCLKVIAKHQLTPQMKAQIAREVVIQSYLVHPNIVAIYGHSHDQENVYLLLEACLGGNLFEKVKAAEGGLAEKEVANTVREACRALDYMHSNDIIHRDIKP